MILRTVVRDCLYVNWTVEASVLPALPEPLAYELHEGSEGRCALVSTLLFRQTGFRFESFPLVRLSYPQCNVRFYVTDGDGIPAVAFHRLMAPTWVTALARLSGRRELRPAAMTFPKTASAPTGRRRWRVLAEGRLDLSAEVASPTLMGSPDFGSWEATCHYVRRRDRGYILGPRGLTRVETGHEATELHPARVEIHRDGMLRRCFPGRPPELHSAWICPEMPMRFVVDSAGREAIDRRLPAPG